LILEVFFESGVILVRQILTHQEYDAGSWKRNAAPPKRDQGRSRKRRKPKA
jgi:hypothetical protein